MTKLNKKGFTLVEMIVVIAIIGILSAVMVPSLIIYVNKQKERTEQAKADAYTIKIQSEISQLNIEESDEGFNMDEIVKLILKSAGEVKNGQLSDKCKRSALSNSSGRRFVFCYSDLSMHSLKKKEMYTVENDGVTPLAEEPLFPNEWQVNSDLITQYYGYFATFTKYRFNVDGAVDKKGNPIDYYGYDITYEKNEYIPYGSEAGLYDDNNNLIEPWEKEDYTSNICSDLTSGCVSIKFNKNGFTSKGTQLILPSTFINNSSPHDVKNYIRIDSGVGFSDYVKKVYMPNGLADNFVANLKANNPTKTDEELSKEDIKVIDNGFSSLNAIEFIRYPEGCTTLGGPACQNDPSLKYLHMPDSITKLADQPFLNSGICNLTLPYGVKYVDNNSFKGCSNLECFAGSRGLYGTGNEILANCPKLSKVYFYRTIGTTDDSGTSYSIGMHLFANCPKLTEVYFDGNVYRYTEETTLSGLKNSITKSETGSDVQVYCHYETDPYEQDFSSMEEYQSLKYWYYNGYQILKW